MWQNLQAPLYISDSPRDALNAQLHLTIPIKHSGGAYTVSFTGTIEAQLLFPA